MFTRPSSHSRPVHTETIVIPSRDIPEQLAAYISQALSTASSMLGTPFLHLGRLGQYGINCLAKDRPICAEARN